MGVMIRFLAWFVGSLIVTFGIDSVINNPFTFALIVAFMIAFTAVRNDGNG